MAGNDSLKEAKRAKNDEFYTRLEDIQEELGHYTAHFKGKRVLCNCDDPYESNFFKYFAMNFNFLGLKKLVAVCYSGSPIANTQLDLFGEERKETKPAYKLEINKVTDLDGNGAVDLADVENLLKSDRNTMTLLKGNGDFRSRECIELLKDRDIVVTNPPFSLFREYVAQLMEYGKKFIILGNKNAITYKEFFPLIRDNKVWIGYRPMGADMLFIVPDDYADYMLEYGKKGGSYRIVNGKVMGRSTACWFTNLDHKKRHEVFVSGRNYKGNEENYPKYDNYDAINVDKTREIPGDYEGVMGVPITFLDKYNPEQFEILGDSRYHDGQDFADDINVIKGKQLYRRILIRRKHPEAE